MGRGYLCLHVCHKAGEFDRYNTMINLGTKIKEYGEIVMIGCLSGERYYWLIKKGKIPIVSMLPASFLEQYYNKRMEPTTKNMAAHP